MHINSCNGFAPNNRIPIPTGWRIQGYRYFCSGLFVWTSTMYCYILSIYPGHIQHDSAHRTTITRVTLWQKFGFTNDNRISRPHGWAMGCLSWDIKNDRYISRAHNIQLCGPGIAMSKLTLWALVRPCVAMQLAHYWHVCNGLSFDDIKPLTGQMSPEMS